MTQYDVMQVCTNGHMITSTLGSHPENGMSYCDKCGAQTISTCPECNTNIKGESTYENVLVISATAIPIPQFCHHCGHPYPWANKVDQKEKNSISPLERVKFFLRRFHLFTKPLRERQHRRNIFKIENEYDVQDLLHAILKLHFDDIRPEEFTSSYAGKSSRMDFLLKDEKIVIEAKMTREGLKDGEVGTQLIDDIARYKTSPDCQSLVCFVYDPEGLIRNPTALENDLSKEEDGVNDPRLKARA